MASFGNLGMSASDKSSALQLRQPSSISGALPAFGPTLPGTGFETLPPLAISTELFRFLKSLGLNSVGLALDCVPFHGGWDLVEWKPTMSISEQIELEFDRICAEIEEEEHVELGVRSCLKFVMK